MQNQVNNKIDEIIKEYSAEDTGLLLIGKYDHNLLKTALHIIANYVMEMYEQRSNDTSKTKKDIETSSQTNKER